MQHAKQLKADGTVEYGIKNSKFLAITHGLIYISAAVEAFIRIHLTSLIAHWLNHIDRRLYHVIYSHKDTRAYLDIEIIYTAKSPYYQIRII